MVSLNPPKQYMAVDIETTSLNPEAGIITAIGFGTPGGVVEIEVNDEDSDEAELLEVARAKNFGERLRHDRGVERPVRPPVHTL